MLSDKEAALYWEERVKKLKLENEELKNTYESLKRKYTLALGELQKRYELENKLEEAKEWLIEIVEFSEDRSYFEKYMKKVWGYER